MKSRQAVCVTGLASELAAEAFIDLWLPEYLRVCAQPLWWLERSATAEFVRLVAGEPLPERAIRSSVAP